MALDAPVLESLRAALRKIKASRYAWPFLAPVPPDTEAYSELIAEPIDISTIEARIASGAYGTLEEVVADFTLMFDNCRAYNTVNIEGQVFLDAGDGLRKKVNKLLERVRITHTERPAAIDRPRRQPASAAAAELVAASRKRPREPVGDLDPGATPVLGDIAGTGWQRWLDESGNTYYFHTTRFVTTNEIPPEVASAEQSTSGDLVAFEATKPKRARRPATRALESSDSDQEPTEEMADRPEGRTQPSKAAAVVDLTDESEPPAGRSGADQATNRAQIADHLTKPAQRGTSNRTAPPSTGPNAAGPPRYLKPVSRRLRASTQASTTTASSDERPPQSSYSTTEEFVHGLLAWDFLLSMRQEAAAGRTVDADTAPTLTDPGGKSPRLRRGGRVPDTFDDYSQYFSTWAPLHLRELKAEIINSLLTYGARAPRYQAVLRRAPTPAAAATAGLTEIAVTRLTSDHAHHNPNEIPLGPRGSLGTVGTSIGSATAADAKTADRRPAGAKARRWGTSGGRQQVPGNDLLREQTLVLLGSDLESFDEIMNGKRSRSGGSDTKVAAGSLGAVEDGEVRSAPSRRKGQQQKRWCGLGYVQRGERGFAIREGAGVYVLPSTWHSASQLVVDFQSGLPADQAKEAWVLPIDSIVSGMREYFALRQLRMSRLLPDVLGKQNPSATPTGASETVVEGSAAPVNTHGQLTADALGLPAKFVNYVHESFNTAQRVAIGMAAAPEAAGFTLVKGPPGTGKTATLTAILNAIHLREYQKYYQALLACALEEGQGATAAWQRMKQAKPRVLVTAPSNVAVDQVRPSHAMNAAMCWCVV